MKKFTICALAAVLSTAVAKADEGLTVLQEFSESNYNTTGSIDDTYPVNEDFEEEEVPQI